jgi:hypothetical protein
MHPDYRYECALAAALGILDRLTEVPCLPKHERLAIVVFSILHAMDRYDKEKSDLRGQFSIN